MAHQSYSEVVDEILRKDSRFSKGAYFFVRSALDFTLKSLRKEERLHESNHVSGQELLEGIRAYSLEQFGPMAYTVFEHWGIRRSRDFGSIVFNLISVGVLGKNDRDDISDFDEGFDFKESLIRPFEPEGKPIQVIQRTHS
jgi:uncharacterized repeat protein (TIGR04138 family)